jgi:hypothetical protein
MSTSDWVGTIGVALILIAYFCSTFNWMSAHSRLFFLLNAVGSAMTCYASYLILYWPFVVLEGIWSIVSVIGFLKAKKWIGADSIATISH